MLIHFVFPHGKLYLRLIQLEQLLGVIPPIIEAQHRPGPQEVLHRVPPEEWPMIVQRVTLNHEPLRKIASEYGVSREAIRRIVRSSRKAG